MSEAEGTSALVEKGTRIYVVGRGHARYTNLTALFFLSLSFSPVAGCVAADNPQTRAAPPPPPPSTLVSYCRLPLY